MRKEIMFLTVFVLFFAGPVAGQDNSTEYLYPMPETGNQTSIPGHLLGYPNQVSGGVYGPEILGMVFGGVFLTFMAGRTGPRSSLVASGFATWVASLLLFGVTLISNLELITEQHVIITSTVVFVTLIFAWNGR